MKCGSKFILKDNSWIKKAYKDYTAHKQTYLELEKYELSSKTIRKYFDKLNDKLNKEEENKSEFKSESKPNNGQYFLWH